MVSSARASHAAISIAAQWVVRREHRGIRGSFGARVRSNPHRHPTGDKSFALRCEGGSGCRDVGVGLEQVHDDQFAFRSLRQRFRDREEIAGACVVANDDHDRLLQRLCGRYRSRAAGLQLGSCSRIAFSSSCSDADGSMPSSSTSSFRVSR